jgi:hypothetical protein
MIFTKQFGIPGEQRMLMVFKPCPICGEVERMKADGIYVIEHDMEKHGIPVPQGDRMTTEELFDIPDAAVFDRLGNQRGA